MRTIKFQDEHHSKGSNLKELILGGQDGLVNVLGVILGVAAASSDQRIIIAAGLAATFAESISMGAVAYTSFLAEYEYYQAELEREKREIKEMPEKEIEEIRIIYRAKGFEGQLLEDAVKKIISDEELWLDTMMTEELHLAPKEKAGALKSSVIVFAAAMIGSLIPLAPFFLFDIRQGIITSILISAVALFIAGIYKAKVTVGNPLKSAVQLTIIGIASALAGYFIGSLFSK